MRMRFVLGLFVLALLITMLVPMVVQAVDYEARSVKFTAVNVFGLYNRYNASGSYIGKGWGSGYCTPTRANWCKATGLGRDYTAKVYYVKKCSYSGCVRW